MDVKRRQKPGFASERRHPRKLHAVERGAAFRRPEKLQRSLVPGVGRHGDAGPIARQRIVQAVANANVGYMVPRERNEACPGMGQLYVCKIGKQPD